MDTREEHSRIIHLLKGYGDERFVIDHGNRVRRGQEGRVLHGYIHGRHGLSAFLSTQLEVVESRLAEIESLLTKKPEIKLPNFTDAQIREFLRQECKDFCEVLAGDPIVAKREIQRRIKKLVLTPKQTPNGTVLEVTGDVGLFQRPDVMLNNVVDEIVQQYTYFGVPLTGIVLDPSLPLAT